MKDGMDGFITTAVFYIYDHDGAFRLALSHGQPNNIGDSDEHPQHQ